MDHNKVRLVRVPVRGKKKAWVLAEVEFDEDYEPVGYSLLDTLLCFTVIDDWVEFKNLIAYCYYHRARYELVRGKLKEVP